VPLTLCACVRRVDNGTPTLVGSHIRRQADVDLAISRPAGGRLRTTKRKFDGGPHDTGRSILVSGAVSPTLPEVPFRFGRVLAIADDDSPDYRAQLAIKRRSVTQQTEVHSPKASTPAWLSTMTVMHTTAGLSASTRAVRSPSCACR
jgi:hypothetical protein